MIENRRYDVLTAGDHLGLPTAQPFSIDCGCLEPGLQRFGSPSMRRISRRDERFVLERYALPPT